MSPVLTLLLLISSYLSISSLQEECNDIEDETASYYKEICKSSSCNNDTDYPYFVLPRINFKKYKEGNENDKLQILKAFDSYLKQYGTLSVYNHGIDKELLDKVWLNGKQFFDQPILEKLKYKTTTGNSGYDIYKFVSAARSQGISDQPMDLTDSFARYKHDSTINGLYGPDNCPTYFLNATNIYINKIVDILHDIHEIAALSLGLNVNYFNDKYDNESAGHFRYYHFPSLNMLNVNKLQMRLSQHVDFLGFNLFFNENIRGLQMKIGDIWIDCKAESKYDLILNTGQLFEIWTNKHWKANLHRVIAQPQRRLTLAYFSSPDYNTIIAPIKECEICAQNNKQEIFEPMIVKEHEIKIFQQSIAELIQNNDANDDN